MQASIAQAFLLTVAGNDAVAGHKHALRAGEGLFRYTKELAFLASDGSEERLVATEPDAWIEAVIDGGVRAFILQHRESGNATLEDRLSVGFANGGPAWAIATAGTAGTTLWSGGEKLGDRNDPNQRIWLQRFTGYPVLQAPPHSHPQAQAALADALERIDAFARGERLDDWSAIFVAALAILSGERVERELWGIDLGEFATLPPDALRLIAAVERAWVFGGMGSWNDLGFSGSPQMQRYEEVSRALFGAANDAIVEAANRSIGPANEKPSARSS